ncbi:hypothetical protein [Aromatoleum sp.]|uniref:hypothetical protein n=1 Tax=Aromatoleum sp. TaxID=2307007 RepID=UPI002FCB0E0C
MNRRLSARLCAIVALSAISACAVPPLRGWLEADMARHMLMQFPLLVAAGALLGASLPGPGRDAIAAFNAHGLAGFAMFLLVTAFWMIPRALDEALLSPAVEAAKFASLVTAGAAMALSWRAAPPVVQAFFVGNWAWMSAAVGLLYEDAPARLCNFYLLDQQTVAGRGLVALAVIVPLAWIVSLARSGYLADLLSDAPRRASPDACSQRN